MNSSFKDNMPRTEEANQKVREAQRAKILEAARQVFARQGRAATMADIAAAAGVSQGLAYRYFASKEEISNELIRQVTQAGLANMRNLRERPGTPGERLRALFTRVSANRRERLELMQLSILAYGDESTPDDLRELLRRQSRALEEVLRELIVAGQASGEIAPGDPDQLVLVLTAYLVGLAQLTLRRGENLPAQPDPEIILRILKPANAGGENEQVKHVAD
jgi:AcrR family transcriptional regulator